MNFEYNGNLLESDRIKLVVKEIITKYPIISIEKAEEAAMLEGRISSNITQEEKLKRLYNIMLVNSDNKNTVSIIYNDFLSILSNSNDRENNIYNTIAEEINNYLKNDNDFPFISDYE